MKNRHELRAGNEGLTSCELTALGFFFFTYVHYPYADETFPLAGTKLFVTIRVFVLCT